MGNSPYLSLILFSHLSNGNRNLWLAELYTMIYVRHLTQSGTQEVWWSLGQRPHILIVLSFQAHGRIVLFSSIWSRSWPCVLCWSMKPKEPMRDSLHSSYFPPTTMVVTEAWKMKPPSFWVTMWSWWAEIIYRPIVHYSMNKKCHIKPLRYGIAFVTAACPIPSWLRE